MRKLVFASLLISASAYAHVEVESGSAVSNASDKITFAVAHGCTPTGSTTKIDTISVKIDIPAGVTSVRALPGDFGPVTVAVDGSGNVTSVTWTKRAGELSDTDFSWYELTIRAHMPDAPFSQVQFNVTQTCSDNHGGTPLVVPWDQPPGATTGNPAPQVKLVPQHRMGWNKLTVPHAMVATDLPAYFGDAQIVWKGNSAYSPSADVAAMIAATPGVTPLASALAQGDEIWVKY